MEGSFEDSMPALDELDFVDKNEDTPDYRDNKKIKEAFKETVVQEVPNLDKLRYDEVSTMKKNEVLPEKWKNSHLKMIFCHKKISNRRFLTMSI